MYDVAVMCMTHYSNILLILRGARKKGSAQDYFFFV